MIFAEYVTVLATALTIFNVYSSSSISAPSGISGGGGPVSLRTARRWRERTMTSSTRIYFTMAVPYVAATVLVNRIAVEEVVPVYIAAVASISGRFNKGRHTVTEWVFKTLRTFTILITIGLFMLFVGLSRETMLATDRLYDIDISAKHVLLCMFSSFRWFAIGIVGFVNAPPEQKKTNIALGVTKILFIWLLLEGTGSAVAPGAWGIFDAVIVTSTPLRNTVYVLYSVLIFFDTSESVAVSIESDRASMRPMVNQEASSSTDEEDPAEFEADPLSTLRNDPVDVHNFEEFVKLARAAIDSFFCDLLPKKIDRFQDLEIPLDDVDVPREEIPDIENALPEEPIPQLLPPT